jgi:phosphatidylserine/phosphatidylglycerophosphate/cardiolipin synthase-like enzyme
LRQIRDPSIGLVLESERSLHVEAQLTNALTKIYGDVLRTLERDPLAGLVSPSLMAATGTIPLSIVSVIPDIMRHYAELIVHAQTEVFLATNYWEMSHSSDIIKRSLVELSRRAEDRADKVVVKIMYDRGFIGQLLNSRSMVEPSQWAKVGLPKQEEIPNILLEVINYHRLPLGTFHAKFLIVDRAVACLNSNNIQDRPNVEMMVHLEGPIVDSFYDVALASWSHRMNPPLPLISARKEKTNEYHFKKHNKHLACKFFSLLLLRDYRLT